MLEENLKKIITELSNGNNLGEKITLVGASKTMSVEVINRAVKLGLKVVAENKVQEFREKTELIDKSASQHFIGHLQTNKVKYLVGKVDLIHSVDSVKLAQEIDKTAKKLSTVQNVLIEINVGGELSKSGFDFDNVKNAVSEISKTCANVKIKGLMAMLPKSEDNEYLIALCKKTRALYDEFKALYIDFEYLSMGMSNDYKLTVQNGSNMVRLGTTIFGERNYGENKNGNI